MSAYDDDDYIRPTIERKRKSRVWDQVDENIVKNQPKLEIEKKVVSNVVTTSASQANQVPLSEPSIYCRLYVGNLSYIITQELITAIFKPFGDISKIEMPKEATTNTNKSYCFIEYVHESDAIEAMACMNGFALSSRPMKVGVPSGVTPPDVDFNEIANKPEVQKKFDEVCQVTMELNVFTRREVYDMASTSNASSRSIISDPDLTVSIRSIHYDITEEDVVPIFEPFGKITNVHLVPNPETGKHKGYGFITFASKASADSAIAMANGMKVKDRNIVVSSAHKQVDTPVAVPTVNTTTDTLVLEKLLTMEEFKEDGEELLREEMLEMFTSYGQVQLVKFIPNDDFVDVYIKYSTDNEAIAAKFRMVDIIFSGRPVTISFCQDPEILKQ